MSSHEPKPKAKTEVKPYSLHKLNRITQQEIFKIEHIEKFESLTIREMEVFELLVKNHNNPQIASKLFISRNTVEQHRKNINRKLDAHTFADMYSYALAFDVV